MSIKINLDKESKFDSKRFKNLTYYNVTNKDKNAIIKKELYILPFIKNEYQNKKI